MTAIANSRCVLAVCDLAASTRYYMDVLGFSRDPIDADGWSFLTRDNFRVMLGECPDARPASELGDHSYFARITFGRKTMCLTPMAECDSGPCSLKC